MVKGRRCVPKVIRGRPSSQKYQIPVNFDRHCTVAHKKKCAPHFFTVHLKKRRFTIFQYDGYCRPGFHIAKTILLCGLNFVGVISKLPNCQNHKLAITNTNWQTWDCFWHTAQKWRCQHAAKSIHIGDGVWWFWTERASARISTGTSAKKK